MQISAASNTTVLACGYPTEEDDDNSSLDVPVSRRHIVDSNADRVVVSGGQHMNGWIIPVSTCTE